MTILNKSLLFIFVSGFLLVSCSNSQNKGIEETAKKADSIKRIITIQNKVKVDYIVDTLLNDYASLISGLPTQKYFKSYNLNKTYTDLQSRLEAEWQLVFQKKINPIHKWTDSIENLKSDSATIFYPFSGADFLYLDAFFRNHRQAILVGLEPLGTVLKDTSNKTNVLSHIDKVFKSLYFSNHAGFFRTLSMKEELNQKELNGALPLLLFYIKRSGYTLSSLEYFNLDSLGNRVKSDAKNSIGLLIRYHNFNGEIKQLNYFSFDLSDYNVGKGDRLLRFANSQKSYGVFLKAASYLMHGLYFTKIREDILTHADFILQDDSGIPYASFTKATWNIELWGTYTKTIHLFETRFQSDLRDAYKTSEKRNLPFMIGYNINHGECNLQVIRRKK